MPNEIDTLNQFGVASSGRGITMLFPPKLGQTFTPDEALTLAATLVAICEHEASNTFAEVLEAVQGA